MLQDALEYLAWGDTQNARRQLMDAYEAWLEPGAASWPYAGDPSDTPER
jgi:hypothetical protein